MNRRPVILPVEPEPAPGSNVGGGVESEKVRHSRESGNPETFMIEVDSRSLPAFGRMTGKDDLKKTRG